MTETNEKKSESIGDRLLRETGRVPSLAECEKEAMRIERDQYKAENKRLAEIITAFLDCDKWLTCKKVGTVNCFEECGQEKTEYEEGKMPVILSRAFKVELTGLLEKYHGRTLDAAFCPYCNTFTLLSMAKGTAAECPVCLKNRQLATITVEPPNAPAPRPESLCKTCKNAPRDIRCLFKESELVGNDTIRCAGYTKEDPAPKLDDGECPACGGEYGKHNVPDCDGTPFQAAPSIDEREEFVDHSLELAKDVLQERDTPAAPETDPFINRDMIPEAFAPFKIAPAAPSVPDTPQHRAADKALEPFSRNQTDCRICENHKFDCHIECNSDPTHPYKNFKKGTKPAPPRPDVSCPKCGHVLTGPNRQHSMYGHCWVHGCICQPDIPAAPSIKIARAAWARIKEFQCWRDPKASMAKLPGDRMYQHDWGCIVTLDDFFGTAPNTNDKIEHHPGAVCPHCKQSIILTDDGRFVSHNEPGWTSKPIKDDLKNDL